jgi:hypothetical protein
MGESRNMGRRVMTVALAVSLALNVVALGWLAWLVADPGYWFPGAYAERGERGPPAHRGHAGPSDRLGLLALMRRTRYRPSLRTWTTCPHASTTSKVAAERPTFSLKSTT